MVWFPQLQVDRALSNTSPFEGIRLGSDTPSVDSVNCQVGTAQEIDPVDWAQWLESNSVLSKFAKCSWA